MNVIKNAIIDAIHARAVLTCKYEGVHRTVEPHAIGIAGDDGDDVLWCYQTDGPHLPGHSWHLLKLDKITELEVTEARFDEIRPGYNRDTNPMTLLYAHLPFEPFPPED